MSKQWLVGGIVVLLAASTVLFFRPAESVSAAPPEEYEFPSGKALRVTRKQGEPYYLSSPEVVRIGDRSFLSGYRVGEDMTVYVPVSEIDLIEQFATVDDLKKRYRIGAPDPKSPAGTTTPTVTEKAK
jgi:hypothetical protein